MILDRLVLHNYGVYAGRQTLELTPPSAKKPVVLIGGLNGGGKTTLLEALQLALFGRRASPAQDYDGKYEDFLLSRISRGADPRAGAGLELTFRVRHDGREYTYRVHRSWRRTGVGFKEILEVLCDGRLDQVMTDQWSERIEEILPSEVAPLFFFDGERIEQLADLEKSAAVLGTAVQSLLGLDIVDRLVGDLAVLERRHRKRGLSKEARALLADLESDLERLGRAHANLVFDGGDLNVDLDTAKRDRERAKRAFRKAGGELYAQRIALEARRAEVCARLHDADQSLRDIAAGSAPLLILRPVMEQVLSRASDEAQHDAACALGDMLQERDTVIIDRLDAAKASKRFIRTLSKLQDEDREGRSLSRLVGPRIGLSRDVYGRLRQYFAEGFSAISAEAETLLAQRSTLETDLDTIDRALADVPDEQSLAEVTKTLQRAEHELEVARIRQEAARVEQQRLSRELEQGQSRLQKELEKQGLDALSEEDSARIVLHSARTRELMDVFRKRVVSQHVSRIEDLVLDSFRQLLRKKTLVDHLKIDPDGYSVTMRDANGGEVPSLSLSAGERQLLAVSLLWGLARAASRPLPFVVDTPLGRLDSLHRTNLVERYFPRASHQTIVLSTDEEIDETYYPKLKPYVGREYLLDYDDKSRTTQIHPGYFFT